MAATKKPTQTPKPISKKIAPKMPGMGPTTRVASKAKATPTPKFTMPTIAEYRSSAAYRSDNPMSYKQYVERAKEVYDIKYKKKTR
jgi:hypothetical protein